MPTFWECCNDKSRAVLRRFMGKRWREPGTKPQLDDIPVDIAREMERKPTGKAALLGGGHGV
jgi:hypothetical protein